MCFGCSKEPPHWDGSFEYPQHMFWLRNKKNEFPVHTLIWRPEYRQFSFFFVQKPTLLVLKRIISTSWLTRKPYKEFRILTLYPLFSDNILSSADNLSKQFGSRSGPPWCQAWSGPKLFDSLLIHKWKKWKRDFQKISRQNSTCLNVQLKVTD